jgi:hypothetical protein
VRPIDGARHESASLATTTVLPELLSSARSRAAALRLGQCSRAIGEQIHSIAGRRCVVRALTPSASLLRGTRRGRVRLAEIGKIRAHQPHIGRHPVAEGRVRDQRENHVHHVVAEATAVEGGKAE